MTPIKNTEDRYGIVAIALHWSMALLVIGLAALGLYMVTLPDVGFNTRKITLILLHKQFGMLALALFALRLGWRVTQVLPKLVEHLPEWQMIAARFVHLCFYGLMFALPMTGWLMSSAAGIPASFLGLFMLPDFIHRNDDMFALFISIHKWLAFALILLLAVHMGAALRHHLVFKDDTLRRMLPWIP
ncbi:superoxide oxidase [Paraburkholderia sacchari]|uniref:cytochrome b n=1 Tax=Paraburkholderia sacchari TaxID=159450 RepID=UPI0039A68D72